MKNGKKNNEKETVVKKEKQPLSSRFTKLNVVSGLLVCLAFGFTFCYFSPIDTYLSNRSIFFLEFSEVAVPMLLCAVIASAVLSAVLMLSLFIGEKLFRVTRDLILGVLIAMYIQMLFLNGGMTLISGDANDYSDISVRNIVNAIIYLFIAFTPLFIMKAKEDYPDRSFLKHFSDKTVTFIAGILIAMQLVGNISMMFSGGEDGAETSFPVFSYAKSFEMSPEKNVVVFLIDRLDGMYMDEALETYPELKDELQGFTYYRNNISSSTYTFPSIAQMLTGNEYSGQTRGEYLTEAWEKDNMIKTLKDNGVRVNVLTDQVSVYWSMSYVKDLFDSFSDSQELDYEVNYTGSKGVVKTMLELSKLKVFPYYLKANSAGYISEWSAYNSFTLKGDMSDAMFGVITPESDIQFYNAITKSGLSKADEKSAFSFFHLNATHDVSAEISGLYPGYDKESIPDDITTLRGSFSILKEYFDQMKELGVFDNSTIIILGDHGLPPTEKNRSLDHLDECVTTGLLIKEAGIHNDPFRIDNETELSNSFFTASILEYLGFDHEAYGSSYEDVISHKASPERIISIHDARGINLGYVLICKYKVSGDAHDFSCWEYIE